MGEAQRDTYICGEFKIINLENTRLVPDLRMNLLSVSKITDHDYEVIFSKNQGIIRDRDSNVKLVAHKTNNLYVVEESVNKTAIAEEECIIDTVQWTANWHRRFGHLNTKKSSGSHLSRANERSSTRKLLWRRLQYLFGRQDGEKPVSDEV